MDTYLDYMPLILPIHFAVNEDSFHLHQNQHCMPYSLHNGDEVSSLLVKLWPMTKGQCQTHTHHTHTPHTHHTSHHITYITHTFIAIILGLCRVGCLFNKAASPFLTWRYTFLATPPDVCNLSGASSLLAIPWRCNGLWGLNSINEPSSFWTWVALLCEITLNMYYK